MAQEKAREGQTADYAMRAGIYAEAAKMAEQGEGWPQFEALAIIAAAYDPAYSDLAKRRPHGITANAHRTQ